MPTQRSRVDFPELRTRTASEISEACGASRPGQHSSMLELLSAQERAVVTRVCHGLSLKAIGDDLSLSLHTVGTHWRGRDGSSDKAHAISWSPSLMAQCLRFVDLFGAGIHRGSIPSMAAVGDLLLAGCSTRQTLTASGVALRRFEEW